MMIARPADRTGGRKAWQLAGVAAAALWLGSAGVAFGGTVQIIDNGLHLASPYLHIRVSLAQPGFRRWCSTGSARPGPAPTPCGRRWATMSTVPPTACGTAGHGSNIAAGARRPRRRPAGNLKSPSAGLRLVSRWSAAEKPAPLLLNFDPEKCHVTLLGLMNDNGSVRLPAVLHLPNQGSLRITTTAKEPVSLGYDAWRGEPLASAKINFVKITFPAATPSRPRLEYRCQITAIYPPLGKQEKAPELRGFQRNWLNILQLSPRRRHTGQQFDQRRLHGLHV